MSIARQMAAPISDVRPGMRSQRQTPVPVAGERDFGIADSFFSTTDTKGIIRSGNQVFARVSGYTATELVGSPHNLIRHPRMPRTVFQLLWTELEAGRPVAAYVQNLAKDGRHYWVMATVVPCPGGYLSVRIKPSTPFLATVQAVYAELLTVEQAVEAGEPRRRRQAMAVAGECLTARLAAAGFPSYAAFARVALLAEVKNRAALVGVRARSLPTTLSASADPRLTRIFSAGNSVSAFVDGLVAKLDDYAALNQTLLAKARLLVQLADEVVRVAADTQAAVGTTGDQATLGAIAKAMGTRAAESGSAFQVLQREVVAAADELDEMFFPVAAASLQAEMLLAFVDELLTNDGEARATADDLGALAHCLTDEVERLSLSLAGLERRLGALGPHIGRLQADLGALRALQLRGRIAVTLGGGQVSAVDGLFQSTADQIRATRRELDSLLTIGRASLREAAEQGGRSRAHIDAIRTLVATLDAA